MKKEIFILILLSLVIVAVIANTNSVNEIINLMTTVYSTTQFSDKFIEDELLSTILSAGNKATSARNAQPWHFTVVKNNSVCKEIMPQHVDNNVLIIVSGQSGNRFSTEFDTALATQNMFLAAQALGLAARIYVMPVAKINDTMLLELEIPDNYQAIAVLRIGYEAEGVDAQTAASPRHPIKDKINYIN